MAVPGGFIFRGEHFCVHQDPLIPLPGFLVIASFRHFHSLAEMEEAEYLEFSTLFHITPSAIKQATGVGHLTLVQEESSIHFHAWFFPWTQRMIESYGKPSLSLIRTIMSDLGNQPVDRQQWQELSDSIDKIKSCWTRIFPPGESTPAKE